MCCELENDLTVEAKMSLFHIAGYVTHKVESEEEEDLLGENMFYAAKYGNYTTLFFSWPQAQLNNLYFNSLTLCFATSSAVAYRLFQLKSILDNFIIKVFI